MAFCRGPDEYIEPLPAVAVVPDLKEFPHERNVPNVWNLTRVAAIAHELYPADNHRVAVRYGGVAADVVLLSWRRQAGRRGRAHERTQGE